MEDFFFISSPKLCIFVRQFSKKGKFPDRLKFRRGAVTPCPCHDVTASNHPMKLRGQHPIAVLHAGDFRTASQTVHGAS